MLTSHVVELVVIGYIVVIGVRIGNSWLMWVIPVWIGFCTVVWVTVEITCCNIRFIVEWICFNIVGLKTVVAVRKS